VNILRIIHRWVGLVLALIVAAVAVSGGLLLLRGPYERAVYPPLAKPYATPLTTEALAREAAVVASIEKRFRQDGGVRTLKFPREGANAFHVYLDDESEAFIDPERGDLIARWTWHDSLPAFLFELHAHLLAENAGKTINGIAALFMLFLTLTGVILWWPRKSGAFRLRRWMPRNVSPGELLRSHAASGAVAAFPILVFAATGAAIVFYVPVNAALSAMFDQRTPMKPDAVVAPARAGKAGEVGEAGEPGEPGQTAEMRPWAERIARVRATFPEGDLVMYSPGRGKNAAQSFRLRLPGEWHPNGRSYVLLNPYDSTVVQSIDARQQGLGTRIAHAIYPVHAATVGGLPYLLFTIVAAVGLAWLAIGGAAAWIQKYRATRRATAAAAAGVRTASRPFASAPPLPSPAFQKSDAPRTEI
jgi:uncharacterized iron-regulated membrane protein